MIRFTVWIAAVLLAVPALAFAGSPSTNDTNPARTCKAQRAALGAEAFKAMHNPSGSDSSAFGKCVSKVARSEEQNRTDAARQCQAEQEDANFGASHGGKSFAQFYGTNDNDRNAYGKCVSAKAKAKNADETKTLVKAGKTCKTERKELDREAFTAKYGGKANAFGKCISAEAKADKAARS